MNEVKTRVKDRLADIAAMPVTMRARELFYKLAHGEDENFERFENKESGEPVSTFRENDAAFRLFGTGVHAKVGGYITVAIGLTLTIVFCYNYSIYHTQNTRHNQFLDSLELVDLIFAFVVGIPCHILLFFGIFYRKSMFFGPFLIFYCTNFLMNIVFTFLTIVAAAFDFHRSLFGSAKLDIMWTLFQILWTCAQGLAIYVVIRCRRYVAAKAYFNSHCYTAHTSDSSNGVHADGVTGIV